MAPRNTVGDVPLQWYEDEPHIGYDNTGKKIKKREKQDKLDSFLANVDDSKHWLASYFYTNLLSIFIIAVTSTLTIPLKP